MDVRSLVSHAARRFEKKRSLSKVVIDAKEKLTLEALNVEVHIVFSCFRGGKSSQRLGGKESKLSTCHFPWTERSPCAFLSPFSMKGNQAVHLPSSPPFPFSFRILRLAGSVAKLVKCPLFHFVHASCVWWVRLLFLHPLSPICLRVLFGPKGCQTRRGSILRLRTTNWRLAALCKNRQQNRVWVGLPGTFLPLGISLSRKGPPFLVIPKKRSFPRGRGVGDIQSKSRIAEGFLDEWSAEGGGH